VPLTDCFYILLGIGDNVGVCFFNSLNLVNLRDYYIREGSFVRDADEYNDVRPSKTGMGLFDTREALE
jgi:hypothetical protein